MLYCDCPVGTSLPMIPNVVCPTNFGQVQKVVFQRMNKTPGVANTMAASSASKLATWTPLLTADNGTRVVSSPYIYEPSAEAGEAKTWGGGNTTPGGVVEILGSDVTPFTGMFIKLPQTVAVELKKLMCEETGNLGIYLINGNGQMMAKKVGDNYTPIQIFSFFVSDLSLGGLEAPDSNKVSWNFPPNWSDGVEIFKPTDFNPLTQLVAPSTSNSQPVNNG